MPQVLGRLCRQKSWTRHRRSVITAAIELYGCDFVTRLWRVGHRVIIDIRYNSSYITGEEVRCGSEAEAGCEGGGVGRVADAESSPAAMHDEQFGSSEFFDARDLVQVKYEMVRRVRVDGDPVTQTAATFGFSRPSYYEAAAAVDRDGLGGLVPAKPGPRRAHKLTDEVIAYARQVREADPGIGSARLAAAIAEKLAIRVHPRSVERALARAGESKSGGAQ